METTRPPQPRCTLANAVTAVRIVGACVLLALAPLSAAYLAVYALCGASDVLDGWLARRTGTASTFGAQLDSAADTLFVLAILASLLPGAGLAGWLWLWIGLVAGIKVAALLMGFARFRTYASLHTYANKLAGLALFALPPLFLAFGSAVAAVIACAVATLAALEELALLSTTPELDRNERGLLGKMRKPHR